jgi:hypothetical protein
MPDSLRASMRCRGSFFFKFRVCELRFDECEIRIIINKKIFFLDFGFFGFPIFVYGKGSATPVG